MSPVLAGWASSETPPSSREPNSTRPDPPVAQTPAAPCKRVADNEHLAESESLPAYGRRAEGPSVSQLPDTSTPDFATLTHTPRIPES